MPLKYQNTKVKSSTLNNIDKQTLKQIVIASECS